ncbi:hypothetical protein [Halopelagius fulvigenes]|uniref:Uncharacterized protein n=1 Tax=Halopelagius fulvigenes TaxID=1198324 RepID=A0ABD5TXA0_9EURY
MEATYDLFPFHEDGRIAAALGTLLVQRGSVDPNSLAEVAGRFGVERDELEAAVVRLGVEGETTDALDASDEDATAHRVTPEFLRGRAPIAREYGGLRDPESNEEVRRTDEMSFQSWLLVEATKSARETVERMVRERFGDGADALRVATRAAIGTAAFPERVLWVGVSYPVDETGPGTVPAVPNPPSFSFDRLAELVPATLDATVERGGEAFRVRNIPAVPFREPHYR